VSTTGGGRDRSWLEPLSEEGRIQTDDINLENMIGCHKGVYMGLNVVNPQPGYSYVWERRKPGDILRARQQGGQVVTREDPEYAALNTLEDDYSTPLDNSDVYQDVVLVRYTDESIRRRREQEAETAQEMFRGGAAQYASRADQLEKTYSRGLPTRFQRADHSIDFEGEGGETVDHWSPDQGVIVRN